MGLRRLLHIGLIAYCALTLNPVYAAKAADHSSNAKKSVVKKKAAKKGAVKKVATASKAKPRSASFKKTAATTGHVRVTLRKNNLKIKHRPEQRKNVQLEDARELTIRASSVLVQDVSSGAVLYEKNSGEVLPIASITKLMTAMVTLDAKPDLEEMITIIDDDVDSLKGSHSRLPPGVQLSRETLLNLALMSSENRAANALSRFYRGGRAAFVAAMNKKAAALGLTDTHFEDPTGLTPSNVSTARDLAKLVNAANSYPLIREFSTATEREVVVNGRPHLFRNSNVLVRNLDWAIDVSKTGYIREAGRCMVMRTWINDKPTIIVLLDSASSFTRAKDATRIRRWTESASVSQQAAPS